MVSLRRRSGVKMMGKEELIVVSLSHTYDRGGSISNKSRLFGLTWTIELSKTNWFWTYLDHKKAVLTITQGSSIFWLPNEYDLIMNTVIEASL